MGTNLQLKRVFNASASALFEDLTEAEKMTHWFYEGEFWTAQVSSNLEIGGKYKVEMVTDIGNSFQHDGTYTNVKKGSHLEMTWGSSIVENTFVTLDFYPLGKKKSELIIKHENFPSEEMLERHREMWEHCLDHLEEYIENPRPFACYSETDDAA